MWFGEEEAKPTARKKKNKKKHDLSNAIVASLLLISSSFFFILIHFFSLLNIFHNFPSLFIRQRKSERLEKRKAEIKVLFWSINLFTLIGP